MSQVIHSGIMIDASVMAVALEEQNLELAEDFRNEIELALITLHIPARKATRPALYTMPLVSCISALYWTESCWRLVLVPN